MSGPDLHHRPIPPPLPPSKGKLSAKWLCVSILVPIFFGLVVPYGIYHLQKADAERTKLLEQTKEQQKQEAERKAQEAYEDQSDRELDARIAMLGAAWSIARPWSTQSLLRAGFSRREFDTNTLPPDQDFETFRRAISDSVESDISGMPEANFDIAQFRAMVQRLNLPVNVDEMIYAAEVGTAVWTQSKPPDDVQFLYNIVHSEYGMRGSRCFLAGYLLQDARTALAGAFMDARLGNPTTTIADDNPKTSWFAMEFLILYDHLRPLYEEFGFAYPLPKDPSSMNNLEAATMVHNERERFYERLEGRDSPE